MATLTKCLLLTRENEYNSYFYLIRRIYIKISFTVKVYLPFPWFIYFFYSACIWKNLDMFVKCWKWFYWTQGFMVVVFIFNVFY